MKFGLNRFCRRRGITLVEVLVAVGILAVLVGILFPVSSRFQHRAWAAGCVSNLRALGVAMNLYVNEHHGKLPVMQSGRLDVSEDVPVLDSVLADYVDGPGAFSCPGDRERFDEVSGTSYLWNNTLNGQRVEKLNFLGVVKEDIGIPMISDKENFHKWRGDEVNILYADGHVDKEIKFVVTD